MRPPGAFFGGWLATVSGHSAASQQAGTARLRVGGMCTPLRIHGTNFQREACLLAQEHISSWRGRMGQWWLWAMTLCVTITSRFTVSIILVVITAVKERGVVAILHRILLHSNVTSVDILIRHWMVGWREPQLQRCSLSLSPSPSRRGREDGWSASGDGTGVSALLPEMAEI